VAEDPESDAESRWTPHHRHGTAQAGVLDELMDETEVASAPPEPALDPGDGVLSTDEGVTSTDRDVAVRDGLEAGSSADAPSPAADVPSAAADSNSSDLTSAGVLSTLEEPAAKPEPSAAGGRGAKLALAARASGASGDLAELPPPKMAAEEAVPAVLAALGARGLSQTAVCAQLSLSPVYLSIWLRNPKAKAMPELTKALYSAALELWLADATFAIHDPALTRTNPSQVPRPRATKPGAAERERAALPEGSARPVRVPSTSRRQADSLSTPMTAHGLLCELLVQGGEARRSRVPHPSAFTPCTLASALTDCSQMCPSCPLLCSLLSSCTRRGLRVASTHARPLAT
jgi:hypothetical protein